MWRKPVDGVEVHLAEVDSIPHPPLHLNLLSLKPRREVSLAVQQHRLRQHQLVHAAQRPIGHPDITQCVLGAFTHFGNHLLQTLGHLDPAVGLGRGLEAVKLSGEVVEDDDLTVLDVVLDDLVHRILEVVQDVKVVLFQGSGHLLLDAQNVFIVGFTSQLNLNAIKRFMNH